MHNRRRFVPALLAAVLGLGAAVPAAAYPPADSGYLDYAEMVAAVRAVEAAHPQIVDVFSIGTSHEGRELWAAKVSDNVATDEAEPEVVLDAGIHGREHMSTEMAVVLLQNLATGHGANPRITEMVNGREVFILFNLNPDGSEFDHASGVYRSWRKNRQPTAGTAEVGTDVNRNFAYRWGTNPLNAPPSAETYRGPSAWSTPEARAFRDFVESRMVGGEQQIRTHVTFHQFGRVVLYPYGYTTAEVPADMEADDHATLRAMATEMARLSGYAAAQSSAWAGVNVGNQMDWMYAAHRIMTFTVEMGDAFAMPDESIPAETGRNLEAAYFAIEQAACPHAVIGRAAEHCPPGWVTRQGGRDRYETAAAVSRASFDAGAPVAYVATGQNFPDALAGGVAAGLEGGPLLLARHSILPPSTIAELERLRPARIVVLGGSGVISDGVAALLEDYTTGGVTRLSGADRYATAAAVSRAAFPGGASPPIAFVATGLNFPDGLAAVPAAVDARGPLLLVRGGSVPQATASELARLRPGRIVVLGGTGVVSEGVAAALRTYTPGDVTRIGGADRYATAAQVARAHFPGPRAAAYLATGATFADALSGGPAAAIDGAPVLLVRGAVLPAVTAAQLAELTPTRLVVLGGTAVIPRRVAAAAAIASR